MPEPAPWFRARGGEPVLVRVAGLPLETLDAFASGLCAEIPARAGLQARLDAARADLADRLHAAVPGAEPELRRFLLAVRRDCHNGRPLHPRAADPRWDALRAAAGEAAEVAVALDGEAAAWDARFEAAYAAELERQRLALRAPLDDAEFVRGLAMASPDLVDAVRALRQVPPAACGRREVKAEQSLVRYLTRAAGKVSPFSTFTQVGLGTLRRGGRGMRLRGAPWRPRSLVRIKRYLLHRVGELLCRHPGFRDGLRVALNDSLAETEPGRFLYLRPHRWAPDPETGRLRYQRDALAAASLRGPLVERLAGLLAGDGLTYGALVRTLAAGRPGEEEDAVRGQVDRLLDAGVLLLRMPWPVHEMHLEKRILQHLRTLEPGAALEPLRECLERLVALEEGYAASADPASAVRALHGAVAALGPAAAAAGGLDPSAVPAPKPGISNLYEDVFLHPGDGRLPLQGIADVPARSAREAAANGELLARLSVLFEHRHDFLHTLGAVARERWPGQSEVGVLEVFQAVQPLWNEYLKVHLSHWRDWNRGVTTWNPRGLPALAALHEGRARVTAGLDGLGRMEEGERRIDPAELRELLALAPAEFTDARGWGAMMLLQPAAGDGSRWMLNRLREGTGRYGSRFTAAMDADAARAYTAHMAARSTWRGADGRVQLLDAYSVHGDTLNVHHPQTGVVFTLPGDHAELPPHRRVRLGDLRIWFGAADGVPRLTGRGGERYLPVNLGLSFEAWLPTLVKFLCAFGPSELSTVFPRRRLLPERGLTTVPRTLLGNLVLHRRAWDVPVERLRGLLDAPDARAFAAVNRARMEWGIPERVFIADVQPHPVLHLLQKPQYLDFSSPLLLPLLRDSLSRAPGETLRITEMLPTPAMCPRGPDGRARAVEVLLDTLALHPPLAAAAAPRVRARSGRTLPALSGGHSTPP
ncbi:MAG TPA: lantibiotic dehydratase [Longimicrobium sp.]|nr:lantibiotic dehydratase [Longimicrobium sp.]